MIEDNSKEASKRGLDKEFEQISEQAKRVVKGVVDRCTC
jgi:hypothetical protein